MADSNELGTKALGFLKVIARVLENLLYAVYAYLYLFFRMIVPPTMKSLDGETFLITGSSTGIGREVVLQLARYHANTTLVLWDWNAEANKKTAEDARAFGATVHTYEIDVTDREQVRETAKKVQEEVGDVTILYNNAGIARVGDFFKSSEEDIDKTIQVNLTSHFWTLRAFMPKMIERNHGHVVTTASLGSFIGGRHCIPYFATKYGIRGYIEALQDELHVHPSKPDKIQFTTIFPSFVETPLTAKVKINIGAPQNSNLSKFMKPDFVAKKIIEGIRQNQEKVFVPKEGQFVVFLKSIIPNAVFTRISRQIAKDVDGGNA